MHYILTLAFWTHLGSEWLLNFCLFYLVCAKPKSCEPRYGINVYEVICRLESHGDIPSWERCSELCFRNHLCVQWSWAIPSASNRARTCWLKRQLPICANAAIPTRDYISREKECGNLPIVSICAPNYGLAYPGCDMKVIAAVGTWERCSQLCHLTRGCKFWTWSHKGVDEFPHTCWLKNSTCKRIPSRLGISGDAFTYLRCNSPCD